MNNTDLTDLFAPPPPGPAQPVAWRQGVILTWDPETAQNTVSVGGAVLTNVPVLSSFEALLLGPGSVVGLITAGPSWGILGRMTVPGGSDPPSILSAVSAQSATVAASESRSAATFADLTTTGPEVTITLPTARCLVWLTARITVSSSDGAMGFTVSEGSTIAASLDRSLRFNLTASAGGQQATALVRLTDADGLAAGLNVFSAQYAAPTGTATFANRSLAVIPF